jgi:ABC-type polysaccharide/polyol phosphate export permease
MLVKRDAMFRYKRSILGFGWALIEPLSLALVYYIVFGHFARLDVPNYPFFLLSGLLPWNALQGMLGHGAGTMLQNGPVIRRLRFPHEVFVLSLVFSQIAHMLVSLGFLLLLALLAGPMSLGWHSMLILPALVLLCILGSGLVAAVSSISPFLRDVGYVCAFVMRLGVYITPIIYEASRVPEQWRWVMYINPMTSIVELSHGSIVPDYPLQMGVLLGSASVACALSAVGWLVFSRLDRTLAEAV